MKLSWIRSLLVTCKTLGNTLTADEKYYFLNKDNLMQPIQMKLSKKQKALSQFFSTFFKEQSNSEHFGQKNDPHRLFVSRATD